MIEPGKIRIDRTGQFRKEGVEADVLRLDLLHPVISGNKWFKLKYYLAEAQKRESKTILTFGGAYSNHIVATAAAAKLKGFSSIGIIRGERPPYLSPTLLEAGNFGMKLQFISREDYRQKKLPAELTASVEQDKLYIINEGGYGEAGAEGAADILNTTDTSQYTHIVAAVGTGTMLAGLTLAKKKDQLLTGIPVLKNNFSLQQEIEQLLPVEKKKDFSLVEGYHFGGYAKHNPKLLEFMNEWYRATGTPSDFVYTGKLLYAVRDLISLNYFPVGSRILIIHSGGLQGNRSLPKGTLIF